MIMTLNSLVCVLYYQGLATGTWTHGHGMYTTKYSIGDHHYWIITIILAICDTFTVVVASQAQLLGYQPHVRMHACVLSKKSCDFCEGSPRIDDFHHH